MDIIEAIQFGTIGDVESALTSGVDPNTVNTETGEKGGSESGYSALFWACTVQDPRKVLLLLRHGSSPHWKSDDGQTCLMRAAYLGPLASVEALLSADVDVNTQDVHGQ